MNHKCPVKGCSVSVPPNMLMCATHWRMVPPAMQRPVWTEYRKEAGSEAHLAACQAAIRAVDSELQRQQRMPRQ